jgi:hypothetical protein
MLHYFSKSKLHTGQAEFVLLFTVFFVLFILDLFMLSLISGLSFNISLINTSLCIEKCQLKDMSGRVPFERFL